VCGAGKNATVLDNLSPTRGTTLGGNLLEYLRVNTRRFINAKLGHAFFFVCHSDRLLHLALRGTPGRATASFSQKAHFQVLAKGVLHQDLDFMLQQLRMLPRALEDQFIMYL